VTNGTDGYKNSAYGSPDIDKNLSDVAQKVAAETDNSFFTPLMETKNILLNTRMYVKQEVYIPMFLQHATCNICRDH